MSGFLSKLKAALGKTSSKISSGIDNIFYKRKLDNETLQELEELLISADTGAELASEIVEHLSKQKFDKEVSSQDIKEALVEIITNIFSKTNQEFKLNQGSMTVIMVCGVNGNGKTTTIGKLANQYISEGKKVAIAACDTFRAAAIDQIAKWAERSGAKLFFGDEKADPASVAYKAINDALTEEYDVLFIDTAGRLHNQKNLMDELTKIVRVIKKIDPKMPHHNLLVIDATTGQNANIQTEQFKAVVPLSGLVVSKLDGTAKAGVVVSIVQKHKLPVYFIGIGEGVGDLKLFVANDFAKAIVGLG